MTARYQYQYDTDLQFSITVVGNPRGIPPLPADVN